MVYQSILWKNTTILKEILKEIKCSKDNNYYVTENAFNITKAAQIYNYINCSGHNLNLVLKHSVEENTNFKNLINAIKKIVVNIEEKSFKRIKHLHSAISLH